MCDPTINFMCMSFESWIEVNGTRYSIKNNMTILIDVEDLPTFITIKYIFFKPNEKCPFLIASI